MEKLTPEIILGENLSKLHKEVLNDYPNLYLYLVNKMKEYGQQEEARGFERGLKEANEWILVEDRLPDLERTVWLCNDKENFVWLGELIDTGEGLFFGVLNSRNDIYGDKGRIVAECEPEDIDATHWQYTPMLPAPPQQGKETEE